MIHHDMHYQQQHNQKSMTASSQALSEARKEARAAFEAAVRSHPDALQRYAEALCSRKTNPIIRAFTSAVAFAVRETCIDDDATVILRSGCGPFPCCVIFPLVR